MFGNRPKRITKLEIFSAIFLLIIIFFSGFVSVMTTRNEKQPGWKTMRNSTPEPNGDTQSIDKTKITQLFPQTDISQYRILFDEAHFPSYYIEPNENYPRSPALNYRLYLELIGLGHDVDIIKPGSLIDFTLLSEYDLLVIPGSFTNYMLQEIDAIEAWVRNGGNILIMTSNSHESKNQDAQAIAKRFGFDFSEDSITDDIVTQSSNLDIEGSNIVSHSITINIQKLIVDRVYGIINKPSYAQIILKTDEDGSTHYLDYLENPKANGVPFMCALNNISGYGGKLIVFSVRNIWDTMNNGQLPNFYLEDNRQLAINTFNWLVERNNTMKIDSDGDTLPDYQELYVLNSNPYSNDTDKDNLLDYFEFVNGMSLTSNDTDNDGLYDFDEYYNLPTDPTEWDSDGDQLGDGDEYFVYGTNATRNDTDTYGIPDGFEVFNLMDPLDETDAELDYDNDQLTNLQEYIYRGDVYNNDTDSDGLLDYDEVFIYYTKVYRNDTDFDGLMDYDELFIYHTSPRKRDTDEDGYPDGLEILEGFDPLDPDDPVPRPWVSTPRPTVQISISIFSILVIVPLIPTAIYIKRKKK